MCFEAFYCLGPRQEYFREKPTERIETYVQCYRLAGCMFVCIRSIQSGRQRRLTIGLNVGAGNQSARNLLGIEDPVCHNNSLLETHNSGEEFRG